MSFVYSEIENENDDLMMEISPSQSTSCLLIQEVTP